MAALIGIWIGSADWGKNGAGIGGSEEMTASWKDVVMGGMDTGRRMDVIRFPGWVDAAMKGDRGNEVIQVLNGKELA